MDASQRDFRLSPSESMVYRDALARQAKAERAGPHPASARMTLLLLKLLPPHAPYDIMLYPRDWDIVAVALRCAATGDRGPTAQTRAAWNLYRRMLRTMRWPASDKARTRGTTTVITARTAQRR